MLDGGATMTAVNKKIANKFSHSSSRINTAIRVVGQSTPIAICNEIVSLQIETASGNYTLNNVTVMKDLSLPLHDLPIEISNYCQMKTKIKVNPHRVVPDIIIGQDYCHLIIIREFYNLNPYNLIVSRCLLGWSIHGKVSNNSNFKDYEGYVNNCNSSISILRSNSDDSNNDDYHLNNLNQLIEESFDLDVLGVSEKPRVHPNDKRALEILDKTSRYMNGEWQVGLLWKDGIKYIPSAQSRENALKRLTLLERKFTRDPEFAKLYCAEMNRLFEKGFAVKARDPPKERTWYLPHFGVTNVNKPGKVRLVFDAAAKADSVSFNDLMLKGPDLLKSLLGVFMQFRENSIGVKGDMRDMYLKVKISPEDYDAQRFFWRGNDRSKEPEENIITSVFFGGKSSPSQVLYVKDKNANMFKTKYPQAVKSIKENNYMDDWIKSFKEIEEAKEQISQVIEINKAANWEMHAWGSNEPSVLKMISPNNLQEKSINLMTNTEERVLGLHWLTDSDELIFKFSETKIKSELRSGTIRPTKREVLSIIMRIYDPLGLIAPFVIHSKILMQDIHASRIAWDEKILDKEFTRWKNWIYELREIEKCKIPRCYQLKNFKVMSIELHVFSDASLKAYSSVAYWRFVLMNGTIHTAFIIAKSRVAPLKSSTVPRLELQAALLGVRLAKTVLKEHTFSVQRRVFWSDSQTVLKWIKSDPKIYQKFVENRLSEINEETNMSEWSWVPTTENPADDATRWSPGAWSNQSRWFIGPSFLRESEKHWPMESNITLNENLENHKEMKKQINVLINGPELVTYLPDYRHFSTWQRLLRSTAAVIEATDIWLKVSDYFTDLDRLNYAEKMWVKEIQKQHFIKEINNLNASKNLQPENKLVSLSPFIDGDGLLRVRGRVERLPEYSQFYEPLILDSKHPVVELLIKHYHEKAYHKNHETVLSNLRENYWILGVRRCLRSIVNKCEECRLLRAHPYIPKMANLPSIRLNNHCEAFTFCGLDYFGPITIKIGRRHEKRWGALFTCLSVRAIHIELAHSLSADSAIMAIQRFASRRIFPKVLFSDNGTNFRGASEELRNQIEILMEDKLKLTAFGSKNDFEWRFNPPTASHMGGAWERMIRSVKECLTAVLKGHAPNEETLLTILAEVENTINSRPLTHISSDPQDHEPLTPNHFLKYVSTGKARVTRFNITTLCLRKRWHIAQQFADAFWNRWVKEYLPTLTPRNKWFKSSGEKLEIGDIVLIINNNAPRNEWRKGEIVRVYPDKENEIRIVDVRTTDGIFNRPSHKIIKFSRV